MTAYWTRGGAGTTRLIGFPAMLVWNRVLWLAIAAAVLAVLHRTFRFAHADGIGGRGAERATAPWPTRRRKRRWPGTVPRVSGVFGRRTLVRQTLAVARQSLAEVMSGRAFQVGFVAAIGLVLLWGWNVGETVFETLHVAGHASRRRGGSHRGARPSFPGW